MASVLYFITGTKDFFRLTVTSEFNVVDYLTSLLKVSDVSTEVGLLLAEQFGLDALPQPPVTHMHISQ